MTDIASLLIFSRFQLYLLIFVIMFLEGPITTYGAAFFAALGYLNIWFVFILSIFGNLVPDVMYYFCGRFSRIKTIERWMNFFGVDKRRIKWVEHHLRNHAAKAIVIIKLVPIVPGVGLFLTGFMKVPFKKFFLVSAIFNIVASVVFCILGFYSGITVNEFSKFLKTGEIIIPLLLIFLVAFYFALKLITKKLLSSKYVEFINKKI